MKNFNRHEEKSARKREREKKKHRFDKWQKFKQ